MDVRDAKVHGNWELASECTAKETELCPTAALYMFGEEMTVLNEDWTKWRRTLSADATPAVA